MGVGRPDVAGRGLEDGAHPGRPLHLDPALDRHRPERRGQVVGGQVRVGVVVHDEVHRLDVPLGGHRQVALDDERDDSAILGHRRHVERQVARADRAVTEEILEDPGDLLVRDLGITRTSGRTAGGEQALSPQEAAGAGERGTREQAGPKKRTAGGRLFRHHGAAPSGCHQASKPRPFPEPSQAESWGPGAALAARSPVPSGAVETGASATCVTHGR